MTYTGGGVMEKIPDWRLSLEKLPKMAPKFSLKPKETALVIIDMQYVDAHADYGTGPAFKSKYPAAANYYFTRLEKIVVPNQIKLIDFFRKNKLRIIYITVGGVLPDQSDLSPLLKRQENGGTSFKSLMFPVGSFEHQILEELKPQEGELVVNKTSMGAFNSTTLDQTLRNMGLQYLVIIGVATNVCVETTARDAADRGFKCVMVEDACAAMDQEGHEATLRTFAMGFGRVLTTDQVCTELAQASAEGV